MITLDVCKIETLQAPCVYWFIVHIFIWTIFRTVVLDGRLAWGGLVQVRETDDQVPERSGGRPQENTKAGQPSHSTL